MGRMNVFRWALFLALLIIVAFGCAKTPKCKIDYECKGPNICNLQTGKCDPIICTSNSQCPADYVCTANKCALETDVVEAPDLFSTVEIIELERDVVEETAPDTTTGDVNPDL